MAQETQQAGNDLLNFNWEDSNDSFFGIGPSGEPIEETDNTPTPDNDDTPNPDEEEDKKKTTKVQPNQPEPNPEEEEEEEDDFFSETIKPGEDKSKKPEEQGALYSDLFKDLKETGIFKHVNVEEGEDIDVDRLFELQQEEYETEVSERLKAWATQELDEDAKAFIKFKRDGGRTEDFFSAYSKSTSIPEGNIDDEGYQDNLIRYQLQQEGWDRDEIEDRLEYLTESGKKKKFAEKYDTKVKEQVKQQKEAIVKQQEQAKKAAKAQEDEFKLTVKDTLDEIEEVKGFKLSQQEKNKIFNFLTKKEHKVGDNRAITGFQKKLAETFQDSEKMILLAKLIESDFDFSGLEKATKTKQTRQVKSNLEQRKNLRPGGSGSSSQGVSLAEYFD